MKSSGFDRLRSVVVKALALDPSEREAFIRDNLKRTALINEALELIAVDPKSIDHYDHGNLSAWAGENLGREATPLVKPGDRLGPYEVVEEIGKGSSGVVVRARQSEPIRREVAIKLLATAVGRSDALARFRVERELLSRLEHANIARVLDSAETPEGVPYLVIEYVDGQVIDEYVHAKNSSLQDRLDLFLQVCRAVGHAHRRGIIHRDIKPSNIMVVDGFQGGIVKVIDFGIAQVIEDSQQWPTALTLDGQILGSPMYMSPEQARADRDRVDTRTDIYALGVLLHELITGTPPYNLKNGSLFETLRTIAEGRTVIRRQDTRGQTFDADLVKIMRMALNPDPELRYANVTMLEEDIQNFIERRPIRARRPTFFYILRKSAQRRPATAWGIAFSSVVLIISGLLLGSMYKSQLTSNRRAQEESEKAQAVTTFLQQAIATARPTRGGSDIPIGVVLSQATQSAQVEFADRPRLRGAILVTIATSLEELDRLDAAREAIHAARASLREVPDANLTDLANVYHVMSKIELRARHTALALAYADSGIAILGDGEFDDQIVISFRGNRFQILVNMGQFAEAESVAWRQLEFAADHFGRQSWEFGAAERDVGHALSAQGKYQEAILHLEHAAEIQRNASGLHSQSGIIATLNILSAAYSNVGLVEQAVKAQVEVLESAEKIWKNDTSTLAEFVNNLATILLNNMKFTEALPYATRAHKMWEQTLGPAHPTLVFSRNNLGYLSMHLGNFEAAETQFRLALALADSLGEPAWRSRMFAESNFARCLHWSGKPDAALQRYDELLAKFERRLPATHMLFPYTLYGRAMCLADLEKFESATRDLTEARRLYNEAGAMTPRLDELTAHTGSRCEADLSDTPANREHFLQTRRALLDQVPASGERTAELLAGAALLERWGDTQSADENRRAAQAGIR